MALLWFCVLCMFSVMCYPYAAEVCNRTSSLAEWVHAATFILGSCHSYHWLRCVVTMLFVFSHTQYCDMHFMYECCDDSAYAAVVEYRRQFPNRWIPSKHIFSHVHQTIHETGCLPSVSVHFEREVVSDINIQGNILEVGSETCTTVLS